jgi:hypothetical protein
MSEQHLLPPVLATPDLRVVAAGVEKDGTPWLRLATMGRSSNPVREVVVLVRTAGGFDYEYSIYDGSLHIINQYRGQYGDPDQDEWIGSYGLQAKKPPMA